MQEPNKEGVSCPSGETGVAFTKTHSIELPATREEVREFLSNLEADKEEVSSWEEEFDKKFIIPEEHL